jgi:oxygen-independent coproporphyrinogen-3 oxidase
MKANLSREELISKYNVPVPRYTSYPTVPYWDTQVPSERDWLSAVRRAFRESNKEKGISLYIHLPFCESLCTYCGCNTRITRNHKVEEKYIEALLAEWQIYLDSFDGKPAIRELHIGGGTPTFFSPENLSRLMQGLFAGSTVHPEREFSFEGHPNNTTEAHLHTLYDFGFRRVSFGIQDLDEKVQKTINRPQPFENVRRVTDQARRIGYESVNFDLIYGLPYQTVATVENTILKVSELRPDRIAFYSYAHVPWIKPGQRSYTEKDLPDNFSKRALYEKGLALFTSLGYADIGMDHFALPEDTLSVAAQEGTLHRNFMGYTTCQTTLMVGLGTSSISDARYAYAQNVKKVEEYQDAVLNGHLPLLKGHFLTDEDQMVRDGILSIACQGELDAQSPLWDLMEGDQEVILREMAAEGLLLLDREGLQLTDAGKAFLRNVCAVFDQKLRNKQPNGAQVFSKAI